MKRLLSGIFFIFSLAYTTAQPQYPQDYFRSPTDFALVLSGTFAELRANHFHSGIDIKTGGVEGKPVYGCADGYISRIKISAYGYGKALYVVHPNGYTTVYGHLSSFRSDIADYTIRHQYELESFEADLFLTPGQLTVKKGEVFCYTGNSGSSMGPHLHFEIRETATEEPINPMLFGLSVKDFIRPTLKGFRIYAEGESSLVNGKQGSAEPLLAGWGENYHFRLGDTVTVSGGVSFGIYAWDLLNNASNKNGINRISMYVDSGIFFNYIAHRFSFSETRYLNALIDYTEYTKTGNRYIMTRKLPNSRLSLYDKVVNEGIFYPEPGKNYRIKVELADGMNNISILRFNLKGEPLRNDLKKPAIKGQLFAYHTMNRFSTPHIRLTMPENCLYENIDFEYTTAQALKNSCAAVHAIHKPEVPLHNYFDLSIRIDSAWRGYADKLVMVRLNARNKPTSVGGKHESGFINARVRDFGRYTLMADTLKPVIKPRNIAEGKKISAQSTIECTISDDLSGIKSYRATLNGRWILMDYDAKVSLLTYKFDDRLKRGENKFELVVMDGCLNKTVYTVNVQY